MKKLTKDWYLLRTIYHLSRHIFKSLQNKEPVIVLTIGKAASTSVYHSLSNQTSYHTFHIHCLSKSGLHRQIIFHKEHDSGRIPPNVRVAKFFRKNLLNFKGNLKIIVIVRSPVDRLISAIFQHYERFKLDSFKTEKDKGYFRTLEFIKHKVEQNDVWNEFDVWFQEEINQSFGIDVYSKPFDTIKKYNIYKQGNVSLLLVRMEDLNTVFSNAMNEFLNTSSTIALEYHNVGEKKDYRSEYSLIKKNLKIEREIINKYVQTKFFKYFYSGQEDELIKKWTI